MSDVNVRKVLVMQNLKPVWHAILDIYSAYGAVVIAGGVGSLCHSGIWGRSLKRRREETAKGEEG